MNRDLGAFSPAQLAELVPRRVGEHVQQAKLIVLKIRTLPDLKKMCGDGKVTFARRLTKLQHYHGGARKERERRNDSCDCSSSLPVNRRHSAPTLTGR